MIDKLKQYAIGAYAGLVAILLAAVYYLTQSNKELKSKNARLKGDSELQNELSELEKQKEVANDSENDYQSTRNKYLNNSGNGDGKEE